jgi:hypothetical protein
MTHGAPAGPSRISRSYEETSSALGRCPSSTGRKSSSTHIEDGACRGPQSQHGGGQVESDVHGRDGKVGWNRWEGVGDCRRELVLLPRGVSSDKIDVDRRGASYLSSRNGRDGDTPVRILHGHLPLLQTSQHRGGGPSGGCWCLSTLYLLDHAGCRPGGPGK